MIARKSALVVSSNFLTGLLNYASLFVIARYYDFPKFALGIISFSYGFVALFNIIPNLGFPNAHIKRISEGKEISKCNATFFSIRLFLTFLMILTVFISIFIWKNLFHRGFQSPLQEHAVYLMLFYYIVLNLAKNFTITFRAKMEVAIAQIPFFIEAFARTTATAYFLFSGYETIWIVYTYIIGGFAFFLSSYYFFKEPVDMPDREYMSIYLKFAIPLALVPVSFIIMTNLDKVLIQLFWGYDEGADYFSVVRICRFINNITVAFGMLLLPTMSAMHAKSRMDEMKEISKKAERYISMILMPVIFLLIFLAKPIIYVLLSKEFYTAIPIMQILPLFALLDALERPYQTKLLGMDLPNFARNRMLIMVVLNVILNIILIPKDIRSIGIKLFGLAGTGAAIATVISYLAGLIYTRIVIYRISKIGINPNLLKHILAGILMGLSVSYINRFYVILRWYDLLLFAIIGIAIYASLLFLMREFRKEDLSLFMDTINPKKMFSYIVEEIKSKR